MSEAETIQEDITGGSLVPTPLPAALPLFATGLGGLGLLGWRRKRALRWGVKAHVQSTFDDGGLTKSMG
jgi:hypothetical protein